MKEQTNQTQEPRCLYYLQEPQMELQWMMIAIERIRE